jgi:HSP20 family molecular chaperone IbpA
LQGRHSIDIDGTCLGTQRHAMKSQSSLTLALVATLVSAGVLKPTDAHLYGGGGHLVAPRRYQFSRARAGPRDSAFDLVSDILSMPVYMNSIMRQRQNMHRIHQHDGVDAYQVDEERVISPDVETSPRYAVSEDAQSGTVELSVELPGVSASDISITLEDDRTLRISGRRKHVGAAIETEFDQSFQLTDDLDPSQLRATLSAGILRVQAKKKVKIVRSIPVLSPEADNTAGLQHSSSQEAESDSSATDGVIDIDGVKEATEE